MELSGKQFAGMLLLVAGLVAGSVGLGAHLVGGDDATSADTTGQDFDGEFEVVGLDEYDSPFDDENFFDEMTTASESDDETMTGAALEKTVSEAPSYVDQTAVSYFEIDDSVEDAEIEVVEGDDVDEVSIDDVRFYDYEAAVDEDDLERGEETISGEEIEDLEAEFETGELSEGEYAVAIDYKFDDYSQSSDTTETLGELVAELDTDGDVDEIEESPIDLTTEA